MVEIVLGVVLIVLGVVSYSRARTLAGFLASLELPADRAHRDRFESIVFTHHLISTLTVVAGVALLFIGASE
jgi:hypothetical protein